MIRIKLVQTFRSILVSNVPVPEHLMGGKKSLDDLSEDEWMTLNDYVLDRSGDFLESEEMYNDLIDFTWELLGECEPEDIKCAKCKARVDCLAS